MCQIGKFLPSRVLFSPWGDGVDDIKNTGQKTSTNNELTVNCGDVSLAKMWLQSTMKYTYDPIIYSFNASISLSIIITPYLAHGVVERINEIMQVKSVRRVLGVAVIPVYMSCAPE